MSTTVEIKGTYHQKTEIFGWVISQHSGNFDIKKQVGDTHWTQTFGPVTLTEAVTGGVVSITASAFGFNEVLFHANAVVKQSFKIELDHGNYVTGTVAVVGS